MQEKISIKGAREHNLKNISLELPRNKMIVFTGLSGSGKSSLAFDTIFAEGQRRYIESLSAYARQFLGGMQKPDVDEIEGLGPGCCRHEGWRQAQTDDPTGSGIRCDHYLYGCIYHSYLIRSNHPGHRLITHQYVWIWGFVNQYHWLKYHTRGIDSTWSHIFG
jgi:hypothetical protein